MNNYGKPFSVLFSLLFFFFTIPTVTHPTTAFAITIIVRNNLKNSTVHFGKWLGKAIRKEYMSIAFGGVGAGGSARLG